MRLDLEANYLEYGHRPLSRCLLLCISLHSLVSITESENGGDERCEFLQMRNIRHHPLLAPPFLAVPSSKI